MTRPIVWAHRGAAAEEPENTLPSFRRALELGADALETDAHMTCDGHVVVGHDPDGARMCAIPKEIRAVRLDELATWDAGWGFTAPDGGRPFARRGYVVPTLDAMLREFPGVTINVDVKQESPSMVERIVSLIHGQKAEDRVVLASFSDRTIRAVRKIYGGCTSLARNESAALLTLPTIALRALRLGGQRAQLPLRVRGIDLARPRIVARCHALGIAVDYWTVNDPADARLLCERGVDGIMTDDPARIVPAVRSALPSKV